MHCLDWTKHQIMDCNNRIKKSGSMHVEWRLNKTNPMGNVCRYINYSILQHRTLTCIYSMILHT